LEELIKAEGEKKKNVDNTPKKRGRPPLSDEEKERRAKEKADKKKRKVISKKGKSMNKKKTGKRGRKPTVGTALLNYINENKKVGIEDLYKVYSDKLAEMNKSGSEERQRRNLYSTLFILNRDEKIQTLEKRKVYGSIDK